MCCPFSRRQSLCVHVQRHADLVDRGLDPQRRYLVVMDGSKALRAGVVRVFGERVVQRCQIHKRRNVREYLPKHCQRDYDRRMRNACAALRRYRAPLSRRVLH